MPLTVHRAERSDALLVGLAQVLASPPAGLDGQVDPFTPDVVAVPTRGVERWIAQGLAHHLGAGPGGRDGVCAALSFPQPHALIERCLLAGTSGAPAAPGTPARPEPPDPWHPPLLARTILGLLPSWEGRDGFELLTAYLRGGGRVGELSGGHGRRWAAAELLARTLTDYGAQRPHMVRSWLAGSMDNAAGTGIPEDLAWQRTVLTELTELTGVPPPAARIETVCAALRADPAVVDLPARLSVFGPTRITEDQVLVLSALAAHRDVHLWLPHPSPALWEEVAGYLREHPPPATGWPRRADPTAQLARHPLAASWARDAREMQVTVLRSATVDEDRHHPVNDPGHRETLLSTVQRDIATDRDILAAGQPGPLGAGRFEIDPGDHSIQIHSCHGPARQVGVLRDVVLHLLTADPQLQPRDILVMCPDLERFAPLLTAACNLEHAIDQVGSGTRTPGGQPDGGTAATQSAPQLHPAQRLRVTVADRSVRNTNPVLSVLGQLLELAKARVSVEELLDLAAAPVVRNRFAFTDDDLDRAHEWAQEAGVRWGLDSGHRGLFNLAGLPHNTWQAGLDRLLLGVVQSEQAGPLGPGLGMDQIESTDIDLVGRLAEFVARVRYLLHRTTRALSIAEWGDWLHTAMHELTLPAPQALWQHVHAARVIAELTGEQEAAVAAQPGSPARGDEPVLDVASVLAMVADRFAGRPTRSGFRTGDLTVCSLTPMRAVPHRVVVLLGMDEDAFPRRSRDHGENALARDPRVGERDRPSEERQLLLDAVMAATDTLVVLYSGTNEVTGAPRPPAVPVTELRDVLNTTSNAAGYACAWERLTRRHPLQDFSTRNFEPGRLGVAGPFSHDPAAAAACRSAGAARADARPFLSGVLAPVPPQPTLELRSLVQFFAAPVQRFLFERIGLNVRADEEATDGDRIPLALDPLQSWQVKDRILGSALAGLDWEHAAALERRRGSLPPLGLARHPLQAAKSDVKAAMDATAAYLGTPAVSVPVRAQVGETLVHGIVAGQRTDLLVHTSVSRSTPERLLQAWIQLLAVVATADPGLPAVQACVLIGRKPTVCHLQAPDPARAVDLLRGLLSIRDAGLRAPLPLGLAAAHAYAAGRRRDADPEILLKRVVAGHFDDRYDRQRAAYRHVWGTGTLPWPQLLGEPLTLRTPYDDTEPNAFAALARSVFDPLLAAWQDGHPSPAGLRGTPPAAVLATKPERAGDPGP